MSNIDNIFKEAAQNKKGDFNPAYWDGMSALIKKDKKKKRGFFWILFGGLLLMLATCGIIYQLNKTSLLKYTPRNHNNYMFTIVKDDFELTEQNDKIFISENIIIEGINNQINEESRVSEKNNEDFFKKQNDIKKETSKKEQLFVNNEKVEKKCKSDFEKKIDKKKEKKIKGLKGKDFSVLTSSDSFEKNREKDILKTYLSRSLYIKEANDLCSLSTEFNTFDSTVFFIEKIKRDHLNIVLGGSLYDDFNIGVKEVSIKSGLILGVNYEYDVSTRFSISASVLGYNRKSKTARLFFKTTEQSFGEKEKTAIYDYSDFYFIELPLNINYKINQKHKVGFGPHYTRLVTSKVNVSKQVSDFYLNARTMTNTGSYVYHYDTFTLNNWGVNIDYQYNYNRFGLNLGYSYGLNGFVGKKTFKTSYKNQLNKLYFKVIYSLF